MIHEYDIKMVVLSKRFVYMIRNNTNHTEFYIGYSLTLELKSVCTNHRSRYDSPKQTSKLYSKMKEIGFDKFEFSIIDICTSEDTDDLKKMTIQYINDLKPTLNTQEHNFDKKEWRKKYQDANKDSISQYQLGYRQYNIFARQLRNIVDE